MLINLQFCLHTVSVLGIRASGATLHRRRRRPNRSVISFVLSAITRVICNLIIKLFMSHRPSRVSIAPRHLLCLTAKVSIIRMNMSSNLRRRLKVVKTTATLLMRLIRVYGVRQIGGNICSTREVIFNGVFISSLEGRRHLIICIETGIWLYERLVYCLSLDCGGFLA